MADVRQVIKGELGILDQQSLAHEKTPEDLEVYIQDVADTVRISLDQSIAILTPWFFKNMPQIYYQTTPRAEKVRHLSAVITGHVFETKQTVELWDRDRLKVTYIGPGSDKKILIDMIGKLAHVPVKMGSLYFSHDKLLFLSTFHCKGFKPVDLTNKFNKAKVESARLVMLSEFPEFEGEIDHYIKNVDNDLVVYGTVERLAVTFRMVHYMVSHEGAYTLLEPFENSTKGRLSIGIKGVEIPEVSEQVFHLINRYGFKIHRAFLARFEEGYPDPIVVMHFEIEGNQGEKVDKNNVSMVRLTKALRTLGWVDSDEYSQLTLAPLNLSINAANFIRSLAAWAHIHLGKENPYYFSEYKIQQTFFIYKDMLPALVDLFRIRFDPMQEEARKSGTYAAGRAKLALKIEDIFDAVERSIMNSALVFIDNILKSNYFLQTKTGLAFKLDPNILNARFYPNKPFGIFFIVGRDYRMFQVRWKDISRGGLRVVMPRTKADYGFALAGSFDEVYGLSFAQQLKNKDIPEGGSKAVLILRPTGSRDRAVKGAINAFLDLLVQGDEAGEGQNQVQVSYYDKEEILYLGPDENVTNELISWIPEQAERRGYKYARAFMSSKPGDGINHKEYGVTSEGLNVFVEHTLEFLGINPKSQRFTVKMTGGPDGDVAGNALKIFHREYGENCRIVAIADGFGAASDPTGLDWTELLRLVNEGKSISEFDPSKLSKAPESLFLLADSPENIKLRNELHFKVKSDIFVPAGGRPYTVNEVNCKLFKLADGSLSCRAVVEGANIFFTTEARTKLQEMGMIIIKDSSANKTGVICSSFEVIASLILSSEEFFAIKDVYVSQVISILRKKAADEAGLLFSEYLKNGARINLVDLSMNISKEINSVTDLILDEFTKNPATILGEAVLGDLLFKHVPVVLAEKYRDRVRDRLPEPHRIAILAAYIASLIVYTEGLDWLDSIPEGDRYLGCVTYIRKQQETQNLIDSILSSNVGPKDQVASILKSSAARELTKIAITKSHSGH
jgi:glutamate dehydrogenase